MTDRLLTRQQVADRFQISTRHLQDLEKEHSIPILRAGRAVRYDMAAILQLEDAIRCPSRSPAAAAQALGKLSAPLPASASDNLRGRLIKGSQKKLARNLKPVSIVVPFSAPAR
ncbi:MAG: helix-turn-helix transcriptional regulator [bacterium]